MNDKTNKHPRTAALLFNDDSDDQSLTATASHENLGQRLADAEAALEQAGVGCWDWQIGTENVAWTAVMESLWGMEPGEFQGTLDEVAEPIFAEDLERWQESVQRAIEQGVEHRIEMRITRKDGSIRWIEA
ncbi:PAS domain-containing protein, partial [Spongiibacter tropicus]|uniref:PAS domain-containing protein n=1 Tax=Spongiibacter tropicus TaxID=454602 RepID=UPI0024E1F037